MIPSAFIAMNAIPQTPNGKIDRLRLPLPERITHGADGPLKMPGNSIEIELAAIWAEVLGIERIGIDEMFVDLGGDSLQAATIAARVGAKFEIDVAANRLLAAGTIGQMAAQIAAAGATRLPLRREARS
jgi:acyl carrier protein